MLRAGVLVVALVTTMVAGCFSNEGGDPFSPSNAPRATLLCIESICNFEATVDPETREANELSIAVNPMDPMNLVATGKDYTPDQAGSCVWDGIYTTKDGGLTWTNANVPGSNWYRINVDPSATPTEFSRYWCATDPVVAFGPDGTAYWTVMPYQCDPISGSPTGRGVLPQGGFNDWFWTCSSMYVLVSEDGGETWPIAREVAFGPRLEHDKQWLTVAPNGNVLLCWDRSPATAGSGTPSDQLTPQGAMVCSLSTDKGRAWSEFTEVNPDWPGFLPWIDYGPDNSAFLAAVDGSTVLVTKSSDGLAWDAPVTVGSYEDPPAGGEYGWPVLRGSDFRMFAVPSLAVDRSDGPFAGSIYVAWFDHSAGEGNVLLTVSRDGGTTWAPPAKVHDDVPSQMADQFMPAVSVGPDGTVDITWYDRRDDPDNHLFTLYYTYSLDGGASFAPNLRVGETMNDEQFSHHQNGMVFLGDYIDLDSSEGLAHAVWVDTRNEMADVYIAHIERPGANG